MKYLKYYFILLLVVSGSAQAVLINNGSHTLNTDLNLELLDWTFTDNRGYDDVTSKLGVGQEFEGYRVATASELFSFGYAAGLPNSNCSPTGTDCIPAMNDFMDLTGAFADVYTREASWYVGDRLIDSDYVQVIYNYHTNHPFALTVQYWQPETFTHTYGQADQYIAVALVRDAQVPVPAPLALIGLGLLAIGYTRKTIK